MCYIFHMEFVMVGVFSAPVPCSGEAVVSFVIQPNPIAYLELIMEHSEKTAQMARGRGLLMYRFCCSSMPYTYRAEDVFWRTWTCVSWSPGPDVPVWSRALWGPGAVSPCTTALFPPWIMPVAWLKKDVGGWLPPCHALWGVWLCSWYGGNVLWGTEGSGCV